MSELAGMLQQMIIGVMAVHVDAETKCGRDEAIKAVQIVMLGDLAKEKPTAKGTYNIVKLAIEIVKQGQISD